jgi:hypothetical protein
VPDSADGRRCQTELNQLRCLPCATDMRGRVRVWPASLSADPAHSGDNVPEDVELELCPDYCIRLFSACKDVQVRGSDLKVRQLYASSYVFCRRHFRELFDVRLQTGAGLCFPVAPG